MNKRLILKTIALIALHDEALGITQENLRENNEPALNRSQASTPFTEYNVNKNFPPRTPRAYSEENFDDMQKQQIKNILLPYEEKIGEITDSLIEACIGINNDVVNLYMEYALRLHTPIEKICQLKLVKIFSQFKVIDRCSFSSLPSVLGIVSRVHYREDESKIELLELMAMTTRQIHNDEFSERLSYIENFPDVPEYWDFQFICNMLICDITAVRGVMHEVLPKKTMELNA